MKPVALIFIPIILSVSPDSGLAQGFRGSVGGARGPGGWAQIRPAVNQGHPQSQPASVAPSQVSSVPARQFQRQIGPRQVVTAQNRLAAVAPTASIVRVARVPFATVRHHPFPNRFFPKHPGVLFIDVPRFVGTTVITSVAPGVVLADRRFVDGTSGGAPERGPGQLAPFDPTPQEVVERLLKLAAVKSSDVLYDLGSGDGRLVIAAAKKFGAKAVGFEIDPGLVKLARENARQQGVENLVQFRQQDLLQADLSPASVVTLYLSYDGNLAVRPQLMRQLKPGARVVSYTFDMGDWSPKIAESYRDKGGDTHMMYLWEIGGPIVFSDAR
jgi:SAM-dependent methyltransferase